MKYLASALPVLTDAIYELDRLIDLKIIEATAGMGSSSEDIRRAEDRVISAAIEVGKLIRRQDNEG